MPVFAEIHEGKVVGIALASDAAHARQRLSITQPRRDQLSLG